ncbi:MAG: glycosyltransferase family 4 protein [Chloroflexota bacterium]
MNRLAEFSHVDQLVAAGVPHDAIANTARLWQGWLEEIGITGRIYANTLAADMAERAPFQDWSRFQPNSKRLLIYHHSLGAEFVEDVIGADSQVPILVVYHNITPSHFFRSSDAALAGKADLGRVQLRRLADRAIFGFADSAFNRDEMLEMGFASRQIVVMPLTFDQDRYREAARKLIESPIRTSRSRKEGPLLLFVSRFVPNKRQEDLVKLLAAYRLIEPNARLALVGDHWMPSYVKWVSDLASYLSLPADAIEMPGKISLEGMAGYFKRADLFVSMSEHEGFGMTLIESMFFELPVMAFASTAVPETMGNAGLLFYRKAYHLLAEVVDRLIKDQALRTRIIEKQNQRIKDFAPERIKKRFQETFRNK